MKDNNVAPSTLRARKSQSLGKLRNAADEKGYTLIEGGLVVITPEGLLNVLEWDGEAWEATHASRVVPLG